MSIDWRVPAAVTVAVSPRIVQRRHQAAAALERALAATGAELAAEDLRLALRAMDRLIGRTDVEDLLDLIFRDFCIGK